MNESSSLYLVGFMGTGKTVVGKCLATCLDWAFVDLDREIEKSAGMPVPEIFSCSGEDYFRKLESQELLGLASRRDMVVATGGGAFCSAENQEIMKAAGITVWLDVPLELVAARCCREQGARPLWGSLEQMNGLLERRRPFYSRADIHIQAQDDSIEDLARRILRLVFPDRSQ